MRRALTEDSLWFFHKDGSKFYPWQRFSQYHGVRSLFVSDGSNLMKDAVPVATIADLLAEVFSRGHSVWLFDGVKRGGLYRFGHDAITAWGAEHSVAKQAERLGAPVSSRRA